MSEVQQILDIYKGNLRYDRLVQLAYKVESTDLKLALEALKTCYDMASADGQWYTVKEMGRVAETLEIHPTELGYNKAKIDGEFEKLKKSINSFLVSIEKLKKKQDKEGIRVKYLEMGEAYFKFGYMTKAMETYRMSSCYSTTSNDVIQIGIKIGISSLYGKDFGFGIKFVNDAIYKNNENPISVDVTKELNTIQALLYIAQNKFEKVCGPLWNDPIQYEDKINHMTCYRDLAFYATISGIQYFSRKDFKDFFSKTNYNMLIEQFDDIYQLGYSYINFDFEKYFTLLDKFYHEFRNDTYIQRNIFQLVSNSKKGVMITYIIPYKKVDLKEMAQSFGMQLENLET